ncbi:hypothetical protein B0I37DRAFT_373050, partial [Chaetomium sp. MPI-CAGE-AT-0009]
MHPADRHASTLNNPRLHVGEFAHPPVAGSGAAAPVFRRASEPWVAWRPTWMPTPAPVRTRTPMTAVEEEDKKKKRRGRCKTAMPRLYLRRTECGYVTLSEGESSEGSDGGGWKSGGGKGGGGEMGREMQAPPGMRVVGSGESRVREEKEMEKEVGGEGGEMDEKEKAEKGEKDEK